MNIFDTPHTVGFTFTNNTDRLISLDGRQRIEPLAEDINLNLLSLSFCEFKDLYTSYDYIRALFDDLVLTATPIVDLMADEIVCPNDPKISSDEKGVANGIATLDSNTLIPISQIPQGALERLVVVADQTARYALTIFDVQIGDPIKQTDTGAMWYVVDQTKLNSDDGYSIYTAAVAWAGIIGIPSAVSGLSGTNTGDQDLSGYVPTSTTVNGHALSGNISVSASDLSLDNLTNEAQIPLSYLDTDTSLATNSDTKVASQKATKAYADTKQANLGFTPLDPSNNLSEVVAASARTNLGLGTLSTQDGSFSGTSSGTNSGDNATNSQYSGLAASKQDTLISATNLKTINSTSLLGSGDISTTQTNIAGNAATVTVANESSDTTCFIGFFNSASGSLGPKTNSTLPFNASTGILSLTTPVFTGLPTGTGVASANTASTLVARDGSGNFSAGTITATLSGNASTVTTNANLTGAVTSSGNASSLGSFSTAALNTALNDNDIATLAGSETLSSKTLTAPKIANAGFLADANGNELLIFTTTASAVNEITYANAATGTNPSLTASGGDSVVDITLNGKGTNGSLSTASPIKLSVPSVDGTCVGPSTRSFNSGYSSTAVGDLMTLDSSFTWQKTDANTASIYQGMLGIALEVASSGNPVLVALPGSFVYASSAFPTFTNAPIYMSETAGAVTQTQPTTTDAAIRVVGFGIHADKMAFFPESSYITHV